MVRTLFLKIFIWFWLAMLLVVVAIVIASDAAQSGAVPLAAQNFARNTLPVFAQVAADTFERGGRQSLADYLDRLERRTRIRTTVFGVNGVEVSGREVPAEARQLAARVEANGMPESKLSGTSILLAQDATGARGHRFVLVAELRRGAFSRLRPSPRTRALRLIAMILTTGVLCYGLARYLTAPIARLRAATQRLAGGDLTARVGATAAQRRDELADLGRDFDRMAERLQSLVDAQRTLVSNVSHELRSPLTRLNLALELARQRAGAEASGALDRIERESDRLGTLIEQLLMLARLESGFEDQGREPVDLAQLVQDIVNDAEFEAHGRNRSLSITMSAACETLGRADLLHSAIENIVRNAVRYTAEGTTVEISLECQPHGSSCQDVIRVRDHGPGVPEAMLAHLFRPFYRVDDARDRQSGGTGLGLAIAKRSVEIHGGHITASNAPGGGLLFEIYLPTRRKQNPTEVVG